MNSHKDAQEAQDKNVAPSTQFTILVKPIDSRIWIYRFVLVPLVPFRGHSNCRIQVHVCCPEGEAKFWIDPIIALATNHGLSAKQLTYIQRVIEGKRNEIAKAWRKHFGS